MARPATAAVRLLTGEREPVRLATTANITLSGLQTIDGVMTEVGDRILVKSQTDQKTNGIYTASEGTWYRAADARTVRTLQKGTTVAVQQGTANAGDVYVFQTDEPKIGIDNIIVALYLSTDMVGDINTAVQNGISLINQIISGYQSPKATIAAVQADVPLVDPDYYIVAFYDSAQQAGSGSVLKKVVSGGSFQNGNGARYEVTDPWLRPEQFGRIGVSAAGDTAAWVAMVAAANARGGDLVIELSQSTYQIIGTAVASTSDPQTFHNFRSIWIRGKDGVEVWQKNPLSKTLKFISTPYSSTGKVKITGVTLVGYAQTRINAGQSPLLPGGEIDYESSSLNDVAGIYADSLYELYIARLTTRNHAGCDVVCFGVLNLTIRDSDFVGLGPTYIRPEIDGNQGNGSDAAIYSIPKFDGSYYNPSNTTAYKSRLDVCNCRIKWHAISLRTIMNDVLLLHDNYFGEAPGQHQVYDSDSDGHSVIGNTFDTCRQIGYKMQFENRAGTEYGPAWAPLTVYNVGDVVRAVSILFICKTPHTSGGSFDSTKFNIHPRYSRRGALIQGNKFINCGYGGGSGISTVVASPVFGRNIWAEGWVIKGNDFDSCDSAIRCDRLRKSSIEGNSIRNVNRGIWTGWFGGTIKGNSVYKAALNGLFGSILNHTVIEENKVWNCGKAGVGADQQSPVLYTAFADGNGPPLFEATPTVWFSRNAIVFDNDDGDSVLDAVGPYLAWFSDTRLRLEIAQNYGTASTKLYRVDGTITYLLGNSFPGFFNTAQNEPAFALNNETTSFTLDPTTATTKQVADVVATILNVYDGKRLIKTV